MRKIPDLETGEWELEVLTVIHSVADQEIPSRSASFFIATTFV